MGSQRNLLIAIVVALILSVALALWQTGALSTSAEPAALRPEPAADALPRPNLTAGDAPGRGRESVPSDAASNPDIAGGIAAGRVRGQIDVAPGERFPEHFELLVTADGFPARIYSFGAADRLLTVDLPLGRSLVSARAEGLASRQLPIVRDSDSAIPPFQLLLEPAGQLGGQVLDAHGAALAELPVSLLSLGGPDVQRTVSDGNGRYSFTNVPVGSYRVAFGSPQSPIAPAVPLEVTKDDVRDLPPQSMPELGEGQVRVLDRAERALAGVKVSGAGQRGGWFEGVSDKDGVVHARFLPAGTFYLSIAAEDGRATQTSLQVEAGRITDTVVQLRD